MRVVLILLLSFTVSGCATLSKEECLTGNWEEIGFRDGTNGRTSDYLQSHAKACEKSDVRPVQSLWEKGRQRGCLRTASLRKPIQRGKRAMSCVLCALPRKPNRYGLPMRKAWSIAHTTKRLLKRSTASMRLSAA